MTDPRVLGSNCTSQPATLIPTLGSELPGYPVPPNAMPQQEPGTARRPSGPCGGTTPHELSVGITGVPRKHCADGAMRVQVGVKHSAPLSSVKIHLNGITIRRTRRRTSPSASRRPSCTRAATVSR